MPFSVHYGLSLMCLTMLLFHVAEGHGKFRSWHVIPSCCSTTSAAIISETVKACYLQEENTFSNCNVEAYIFITENNKWCVDPRAWWIPQRLKKLAKRGIYCKTKPR